MSVVLDSRLEYTHSNGKILQFPIDSNVATINLNNLEYLKEWPIGENFTKVLHVFPLDESTLVIAGVGHEGKNSTWIYEAKESELVPISQISDNIPLVVESDMCITYLLVSDSIIEIWDHKLAQPFKKRFKECIFSIEINRKLNVLAAFGEKNIHLLEENSSQTVKHNSKIKHQGIKIHPLAWGPLQTLAIGGSNNVRYISGSKWSLYEFQTSSTSKHSNAITLVRFQTGDKTLLITVSSDSLIVWDFDEEILLNKINRNEAWPSIFNFFYNNESLYLYYQNGDELHVEPVEVGKRKRLRGSNFIDLDAEESPTRDNLFESPTKHSTGTPSSADLSDNSYEMDNIDNKNDSLHSMISKMRKRINSLETILTRLPTNNDNIITPGQCPPPVDAANQWCMFWSQIGHVSKSCALENQTIHIHMFSGQHAGNIKVADKYNCSLVSLALDGYAMAADIVDSNTAFSIISFSLFTGAITWERKTRVGETIKAIALGSTFLAIVTSTNTLYIFSVGGCLLSTFQLSGTCVAMAGHEQLLVIITKISNDDGIYAHYQHVLFWVKNIKEYSVDRNKKGCVVTLSKDIFTLPNANSNENFTGDIDWINISDNLICHIKVKDMIYGLYPTSVDLDGNYILQWVPLISLLELNNFVNSLLFPLYIEMDKICYIKLRPGHYHPTCNIPTNFFGYNLLKAHLRIDSVVSNTLAFKKYNSLLSLDPQLKEMVNGEDGKMQVADDVVSLDWKNYDEMRYRLSLYSNYFDFITHTIIRNDSLNPNNQSLIDSNLTKIGESERISDKWALRIIRKTFEDRKTQCTAREVLYMIKANKGLEIAASIMGPLNQPFIDDAKRIKDSRLQDN